MRAMTRCVAIAVAICLAGQLAWGHTFPPVRTVVLQVEGCELEVLVGYRPASGDATDTLLARLANEPESQRLIAAKSLLAQQALAPLTFSLDGKRLQPASVQAKIGVDPTGTKPMVVVLVTFAIPVGGDLALTSRDAKTTRISWTDRSAGRIDPANAPGQGKWFTGVASFLLTLAPSWGACDTSPSFSSPH